LGAGSCRFFISIHRFSSTICPQPLESRALPQIHTCVALATIANLSAIYPESQYSMYQACLELNRFNLAELNCAARGIHKVVLKSRSLTKSVYDLLFVAIHPRSQDHICVTMKTKVTVNERVRCVPYPD